MSDWISIERDMHTTGILASKEWYHYKPSYSIGRNNYELDYTSYGLFLHSFTVTELKENEIKATNPKWFYRQYPLIDYDDLQETINRLNVRHGRPCTHRILIKINKLYACQTCYTAFKAGDDFPEGSFIIHDLTKQYNERFKT